MTGDDSSREAAPEATPAAVSADAPPSHRHPRHAQRLGGVPGRLRPPTRVVPARSHSCQRPRQTDSRADGRAVLQSASKTRRCAGFSRSNAASASLPFTMGSVTTSGAMPWRPAVDGHENEIQLGVKPPDRLRIAGIHHVIRAEASGFSRSCCLMHCRPATSVAPQRPPVQAFVHAAPSFWLHGHSNAINSVYPHPVTDYTLRDERREPD